MLAKRIIPTILCRGKTAYKGRHFDSSRSIGSALAIAQVHARRGVDELMLLDVSATAEGRGPDLDLVRELTEGCFIPVTVGGGVKTLNDINALLRAGADKVAICTAAWEDKTLIPAAAARFGRQALVCVVEYGERLTTSSGTDPHLMPPLEWARELESMGAGEILLQRTDTDGTMTGYHLDRIANVSGAVDIPVIASGGCRDYADMLAAFKAGADACAAGAMFAFTDATPKGAARYLQKHGLEMRC